MNENELIKVNYENANQPTVMGRELWKALEIKIPYLEWFSRISKYGFIENLDFCIKTKVYNNGNLGVDHQLTLGMAKELCILQRSKKGQTFRQYFMEIQQNLNKRRNKNTKGKLNMNNQVRLFENIEFGSIRTVEINGEPYFVGKDVATILAYKDTADALKRHVDDEDKRFIKVGEIPTLELNSNYGTYIINESGLYSLILSSKLPNAKKFKRWVTSEVLPSIRKHGMYATDELLANPDFAIKVFQELKAEREKCLQLQNTIEEQQPKVDLADLRIDKLGCYSITDVTRTLKLKKGQITKWAKSKGYLHKTLHEVNKNGTKYFKIYSKDGVHNQIGITDNGLSYINSHISDIQKF